MSELNELIASSLDGMEGREEVSEEVVEQPPVEEAPPLSADDPAKAEEEELAKIQAELVAANPKLVGKMDVARHQAVVTRHRNAHEKALAELSPFKQKYEALKWAEDEGVKAALEALALAESDPKRFAEALMKDPKFAEILQLKEVVEEVKGERPAPNATTEDGKYQYYDDRGVEELLNWHREQTEKALMEKLEKRFGPVEKEYQSRILWNQSLERSRTLLNHARETWDGFKENEEGIKAYMAQNRQADLNEAYRAVVVKAYKDQRQANEQELRKKWMEEMKKKPVAARGSENDRTKPEATSDGEVKERDIRDVIRASLPRE